MNQTLLVGLIGVALSGLFGYHGIYASKQKQVHVIQAQITEEQANQQAQARVAGSLRQLEQYRKRLAPEPDTSWVVREIVALSKRAGVQLTTINQDNPQAVHKFTRLSVSLQFAASYHQVGSFLDELERSEMFFHVDHLQIGSLTEPDQPPTIHLVVSTFYMPPAATSVVGAVKK